MFPVLGTRKHENCGTNREKLKQQLLPTANFILLLLTYPNIFNSLNINNRDTQHGKEIICCHSYAVCPLTIDVETPPRRTTTNTTTELWCHYFRCDQRTGMPSGDYLQRGDLIIEAQCF